MVALVLTRRGFDDLRPRIDASRDAVWVGPGVLSATEAGELRRLGINLTEFAHRLDPEQLEADIATVIEHHPGKILRVEAVAR